ncbi:hypothetical protein LTR05_008007 [Lithohypha guttulata]|uniref:Uncharacterized protein n=1 Tax=Lithohypha guttulata TaxID=1690604 RepID=A0AAN7Y3T3_9EURO|nr:hypothetical protein LTR05_008007 [Lithohypha guttulata]
MSEPIPEAIPTSADKHSRRPIKRLKANSTPVAAQANEIDNLMWDPERPVDILLLSSETKSKLAPPPEIVTNVQGSSAGAGSGEFHVYKASRRRENERLRAMDEEAEKEVEDDKWVREQEEKRRRDEEKTAKKRAQRSRRKNKGDKKDNDYRVEDGDVEASTKGGAVKKPLQIPKRDESNKDDTAAGTVEEAQNGITIHDDD